MSNGQAMEEVARHLAQAWRSGTAWTPAAYHDFSAEEAYAIQDRVAALLEWFPDGHPRAWKAGGNPILTAAPLPHIQHSGSTWHASGLAEIVVEAEVALRLARAPDDAQDVSNCIGTMCVAIEIVGTRMHNGLKAPSSWKLADQQVHAGFVIGAETLYAMRDWQRQRGTIVINGEVKSSFEGSHPNGNPAHPLTFLFEHARKRTGGLRAGDIVTTGAWAIVPAKIGDAVQVQFDGLGEVSVRIAP